MQDRFEQARTPSVEVDGTAVWAIYEIPLPVSRGRIRFLSDNGGRAQGIALAANGSALRVNDVTGASFRLWTDTAPPAILFEVVDPMKLERLRVWNVWRMRHGAEDAWTGDFGMVVEPDDDSLLVHCSNGLGALDFSDLRFRIEWSRG